MFEPLNKQLILLLDNPADPILTLEPLNKPLTLLLDNPVVPTLMRVQLNKQLTLLLANPVVLTLTLALLNVHAILQFAVSNALPPLPIYATTLLATLRFYRRNSPTSLKRTRFAETIENASIHSIDLILGLRQ